MDWTPETIHALRKHIGDTQEQFAARCGSDRRQTVYEWETDARKPSGPYRKLFDMLANEYGFTEAVAKRKIKELEGKR